MCSRTGGELLAAADVDGGIFAPQGSGEVCSGAADPVVDRIVATGTPSRRATSEAGMPFAYAMIDRKRSGVVLRRRKASVSRAR